MYDSEYFKKVIGDNYNPEKVYTTYKNDYENNIFPVNTEAKINDEEVKKDTIELTELQSKDTTESMNVNKTNPQVMSYDNSPYPEDYYSSIMLQNYNNNYNEYPQIQNCDDYPEIYNIVNPMVEDILSKNQDMVYNRNVVDSMTVEIYNAIEVDNNPMDTTRNVNYTSVKDVNTNVRPKNRLLYDLIKILLLNHIHKEH